MDDKRAKMSLEELLRLYEANLDQDEPKTTATRRSILKIFKNTFNLGLGTPVSAVSTGELELWLSGRKAKLRNTTFNE